jgi:hypothetical protein
MDSKIKKIILIAIIVFALGGSALTYVFATSGIKPHVENSPDDPTTIIPNPTLTDIVPNNHMVSFQMTSTTYGMVSNPNAITTDDMITYKNNTIIFKVLFKWTDKALRFSWIKPFNNPRISLTGNPYYTQNTDYMSFQFRDDNNMLDYFDITLTVNGVSHLSAFKIQSIALTSDPNAFAVVFSIIFDV